MSEVVTIHDTVCVLNHQNNSEQRAIVKFIGSIEGQIGTYYGLQHIITSYVGLDLNKSTSSNTYSSDFQFVKRKDIISLSEACDNLRVTVGDIVNIPKFNCHGIIRYIGNTQFKPEIIWYGLQLEEPNGKNNGCVQGIEYFTCEENYGIFVKENGIEPIKHKKRHSKSKKKHSKLIKTVGELSKRDSVTCCKYVNEEDLQYWCNRDMNHIPVLEDYENMRANGVSNDEIAQEMFDKNVPAYWINKFFVSANV